MESKITADQKSSGPLIIVWIQIQQILENLQSLFHFIPPHQHPAIRMIKSKKGPVVHKTPRKLIMFHRKVLGEEFERHFHSLLPNPKRLLLAHPVKCQS